MNATEVMQEGVVSVSPELPVDELEEILTGEEISGAPVTDQDGKVVGVVSKTDIVRYLSEQLADVFTQTAGQSTPVSEIMTTDVVCVEPDADLRDVAQIMLDQQVHRIFVRDGGDVVGIITTFDLIRGLLEGSQES